MNFCLAGQNKKRGIIIKCCGIKKCIGTRKKKRTTSFSGNSSATKFPEIKATPRNKVSTVAPVRTIIFKYHIFHKTHAG